MLSKLQNSSTLDLLFTIRGGVPTSTYTIFEHVNLLPFNIYLKNLNCNFLIISMSSRCESIGGRGVVTLSPVTYLIMLRKTDMPLTAVLL